MKRLRWVWPIFAACLLAVLAGMAWISYLALDLYRTQREGTRLAEVQERLRLSLYRLDAAVRPVIMSEASRPYYCYRPFHAVERAYTQMLHKLDSNSVSQPSQLLTFESPYIHLHFQWEPPDTLTSPEAPTGVERDTAVGVYVEASQIRRASLRLARLRAHLKTHSLSGRLPAPDRAEPLEALVRLQQGWGRQVAHAQNESPVQQELPYQANEPSQYVQQSDEAEQAPQPVAQAQSLPQRASRPEQNRKNVQEFQARQYLTNQDYALHSIDNNWNRQFYRLSESASPVREGLFKPLWIGDALLLARRVQLPEGEVIQGCWINWEHMQQWLTSQIQDLLPRAKLAPIAPDETVDVSRALSVIPVQLVPGPVDLAEPTGWAPVHYALLIAWVCVLLGAGVVGVVLFQAVGLSQRRGAFVSAVTHEMRTPLTTFRLYSEMLAEGMVTDEDRRNRYLQRLKDESDRLGHLVDNVLAYARLSGPRRCVHPETLGLGTMVEGMFDRLASHAGRAGMDLKLQLQPEVESAWIRADASAVEQILLNLVDNACKYASRGHDKRLELRASTQGGQVRISLCDYGPGISETFRPKLFRPFGKSADEAATSAPGIGLGLALSRRLARNMCGDLRLDPSWRQGACFVLELPRVAPGD